MKHVPLDILLGRMVRARDGARVGRIEEMQIGEHGEVTDFLVGRKALLERLSALGLLRHKPTGLRIGWDQIDISDPAHPRLTCEVGELKRF